MLQSIRARFSLMFIAIALLLVAITLFDALRNQRILEQLTEFSQNFNPATSAILNGDRDLHQVKISEIKLISPSITQAAKLKEVQNWSDNFKQSKERMQDFKALMGDHPSVISTIKNFDSEFQRWYSASQQVLAAAEQQNYVRANELHYELSVPAFDDLREIFNIAGEALEVRVAELDSQITHISNSQTKMTVIIALIAAIFSFVIAYFGPKSIAGAINNITQRIDDITQGDGNLTQRIPITGNSELTRLATAFNTFIEQLQHMVISINHKTQEVNSSVQTLSAKSNNTLEISTDQSQFVESIATAVNQMSAAVREVAKNANETASEITKVNTQTEEGKKVLNLSIAQIDQLSVSVKEAVNVIEKLSDNSAKIASVLDVIRGIAEQTNLLALNAAIEAARAGEQGRGFAVVADEVRTLASRTETSTQDIQQMIEMLQKGVQDAVKTIEAGAALTDSTVDFTAQTRTALDEILVSTSRVSDMSGQTAIATEEQTHVSEEINRNLTELSQKTYHCNDVINETQAIAKTTQTTCQALQQEVARFKVS